MPELEGVFHFYKALKKLLKRLGSGLEAGAAEETIEAEFVAALDSYLASFNTKWQEQERSGTIRLHLMEDRAATVSRANERLALRQQLLDFHGETLLMMHWSILTYTGMVKILKKYHKRTGLLLHAAHLRNLLSQPFCSTDLISCMIDSVEALLAQLADTENATATPPPPAATPAAAAARFAGQTSALPEGGASTLDGGSPQNSTAVGPCAAGLSTTAQAPLAAAREGPGGNASGGGDAATAGDGEGARSAAPAPERTEAAAPISPANDLTNATPEGQPPGLSPQREQQSAAGGGVAPGGETLATPRADSNDAPADADRAEPSGLYEALPLLRPSGGSGTAGPSAAAAVPDSPHDSPCSLSSDSDDELSKLMAGNEGGANADESLPAICQQTRLALSTWKHLLKHSTTPSTIIPPNKRARSDGEGSDESHKEA